MTVTGVGAVPAPGSFEAAGVSVAVPRSATFGGFAASGAASLAGLAAGLEHAPDAVKSDDVVTTARRSLSIAGTLPQVYRHEVRVVVFVSLTAMGCGFQPSSTVQTGDANGSALDAADLDGMPHADAKVFLDAPSCPDDDHDGVCNAQDDWPCGAKPTAPPTLELANGSSQDFKFQNLKFRTVATALVVTNRQQATRVQFNWMATDTGCTANCIDQLEVGFHLQGSATVGKRVGCLIDQAISKSNGSSGTVDDASTVVTPNATGVFELRAGIAQNFSCNLTTDYYAGEPATVMALFCITP